MHRITPLISLIVSHMWYQSYNGDTVRERSRHQICLFLMGLFHCYVQTDRQVSDQFSVN